jgi:hypothetical protein
MGRKVNVGDRFGVLRDFPDETHQRKEEKTMNKNLMRRAIQPGALIVLVGWASWALAAPKPTNVPHPCDVTVADRPGDSILSDGEGFYRDGEDGTGARLWDMGNGVADHLYFAAGGSVRNLKLSIPGVTGGVQTCASGIFQPNVNSSGYQFYNLLPVGSSTADVGQNFGGLFQCRFGPGNRDSYSVTYGPPFGEAERPPYGPPCIVIAHTADKVWTLTADAGCTAVVTKHQRGNPDVTWSDLDVPFQVTAHELP